AAAQHAVDPCRYLSRVSDRQRPIPSSHLCHCRSGDAVVLSVPGDEGDGSSWRSGASAVDSWDVSGGQKTSSCWSLLLCSGDDDQTNTGLRCTSLHSSTAM